SAAAAADVAAELELVLSERSVPHVVLDPLAQAVVLKRQRHRAGQLAERRLLGGRLERRKTHCLGAGWVLPRLVAARGQQRERGDDRAPVEKSAMRAHRTPPS